MSVVDHQGRQTAYTVSDRGADGPPVCFVHGAGGSRDVWRAQHRLADSYPIVALDLSGHGDSSDVDARPGYPTLSAYADDVLAVFEATDAEILVGSSLGGAVILHLLLERSVDPTAIVLTGTGARMGVLEDLLQWLETDFERAVEFLHEPGRLFADPDPELRARSMDAMDDCGQAVTRRDFLTCHRFDVRDRLGELHTPTLALCGTADQLTPPWYHEFLADEIEAARYAEVENAAHLVMLEQPSAFNDHIRSFLDNVTDR